MISWICQRILVEFKDDRGCSVPNVRFTVGVSNTMKWRKLYKNSQLFNLVKTRQVYEKKQSNLMKQHE